MKAALRQAVLTISLCLVVTSCIQATEDDRYVTPPCYPCVCFNNTENQFVGNCSSRNLTTVPASLPSTVQILLMRNNDIKTLQAEMFSNLTKLIYLDLSDNKIFQIDSKAFYNLTDLQELHLKNNYMRSYPENALSALVSLKRLYMDGLDNEMFGQGFLHLRQLVLMDLSGDGLRKCKIITLKNNTFTNLPHLETLVLSRCNITDIAVAAFSPLTSLNVLDLSYNTNLGFPRLGRLMYGVQNSSLRVLKANAIVHNLAMCVIIKKEHLEYFRNTHLETLYVDENRIEAFESGALSLLPTTLKYISAERNRFTVGRYINEVVNMVGLISLSITYNDSPMGTYFKSVESSIIPEGHDQIWDACAECLSDIVGPYPWELSSQEPDVVYDFKTDSEDIISDVNGKQIICVHIPPYLQTLKITRSHLQFKLSRLYFTSNNISILDLSFNLLDKWKGPIYGLENVTHLNLSNNWASIMSNSFFDHFDRLEYLNLAHNLLGRQLENKRLGTFLQPLTSLKYLDLSNNGIHRFYRHTFDGLVSLETLIVTENVLYLDWPLRVILMKSLKLVNFSNNQIRWLSNILMDDFTQLSESQNITLDLSNNPLACTCDKFYFIDWIVSSRINFYNVDNYYCILADGNYSRIGNWKDNLDELRRQCRGFNLGLVVGVFLATLVLLIVIVGAVVYRFRWKLRYWFYAARLRYRNAAQSRDEPFDYAAFVSYADDDRTIVITDMLEKVERTAGLRLNIHHRDFIPGGMIVESIISAIQKSSKTLVMLSRNFLDSSWCMYELQMALMEEATTGRDIVVVVMLEYIAYNDLPRAVRRLVDTDSYIHYQLFDDKDLFWERVVSSLKDG
ncbi:toll-like receptor 4 [Gigantopelta aegis]|uniref:toll-like receptor 4 n=1 Tax=Gigantopelta aegis TaxID=1735272 RepID=UPI001B88CDC8|nr:toll-like receptor 4 [Gigantopelta aegis]XP_041347858.1 toll-like receptor 4 [Gigantopelta aegis]XP_041347859.1 toll-like receptor 4 [Gigantopelta aegis]